MTSWRGKCVVVKYLQFVSFSHANNSFSPSSNFRMLRNGYLDRYEKTYLHFHGNGHGHNSVSIHLMTYIRFVCFIHNVHLKQANKQIAQSILR